MGDETKIEWADSTINLWAGCTRVSPGCDNCYAAKLGKRLGITWDAPPKRMGEASWGKIEQYQRGAKRFFKAMGRRRRVFINSLSDFLDNQAEQAWRDAAAARMEAARDVIFILVTKRPQNARRFLPAHWFKPKGWPENVWFLVTAENQTEYDRRVSEALAMGGPSWIGISMEPMLQEIHPGGSFSFSEIDRLAWATRISKRPLTSGRIARVGWLILGGESGRGARPYPEHSAGQLATRAGVCNIPVFSKQLGQADRPGSFKDYAAFPSALQVRSHPE